MSLSTQNYICKNKLCMYIKYILLTRIDLKHYLNMQNQTPPPPRPEAGSTPQGGIDPHHSPLTKQLLDNDMLLKEVGNKWSDRSREVLLSALFWEIMTDRPTDGQTVSQGSSTSKNKTKKTEKHWNAVRHAAGVIVTSDFVREEGKFQRCFCI